MKKTARKHQRHAIDCILYGLATNLRAQVHMPCGSGKTLSGIIAADEYGARTVVIFVPALSLIYQTWEELETNAERDILAVCSETMRRPDGATLATTESPDEVAAFLRKHGRRAVLCTYQSAPALKGLYFDLGIFDEAHKTAGRSDKEFGFALSDENIEMGRRLFMTATPRHVEPHEELPTHSMDDETVYGPCAHRYSFRQGVGDAVICDYRIIVSVVRRGVRRSMALVDDATALQVAVDKTMRRFGVKKGLTYHQTIAAAKSFIGNADAVFQGAVQLFHVNGEQSASDRARYMQQFEDADRAIISNARSLIEGVNIPAVDLVVFADPKRSYVDIIQAIGRAVRKPFGSSKTTGYVLLPLFVEQAEGESVEAAIDRADFHAIFDVFRILQEQDEVLANRLLELAKTDTEQDLFDEELIQFDADERAWKAWRTALKKAIGVRVIDALVPRLTRAKERLLHLARTGAPRPVDPYLKRNLSNFTSPYNARYDAGLTTELRGLAPTWFIRSSAAKKALLLERARAGEPQPRIGERSHDETRLAHMFYNYVKPRHRCYDKAFAEAIRLAAPDWLPIHRAREPDSELKRRLRELARDEEGFTAGTRRLKDAFHRFTNPGGRFFDATLTSELAALGLVNRRAVHRLEVARATLQDRSATRAAAGRRRAI